MNKTKLIIGILATVVVLTVGGYVYFKVITSKTWLRTTALLDTTVGVEAAYNIKTKGWDARGYEVEMQSVPGKVCLIAFGTDIPGVGVGCVDKN